MEYNKKLTTEEIHADMRKAILSRQYSVQDFILEKDVCEKYGISKAIAKEVLHRLCTEGFLQSYPRKGYMLRIMARQDYPNLAKLRFHVESYVMSQIISQFPEKRRKELLTQCREAGAGMSNAEFHMMLANLLDDPYIDHTMNYLLGMIVVSYYSTFPNADESQMTNCHERILNALYDGDEKEAIAALYADTHMAQFEA